MEKHYLCLCGNSTTNLDDAYMLTGHGHLYPCVCDNCKQDMSPMLPYNGKSVYPLAKSGRP